MPDNKLNPADKEAATPALSAPDFFIHTSPEMDALERAAADGKHGRHYQNLDQEPARVHQIQGASHYVRLELKESELALSSETKVLEALTDAQDADAALAFLYISHILAPPSPLPPNATAAGKVDFDDVIAKIGWDPRSSEERREMHKKLFQFILFGERAQVVGKRRGKYTDRHTGEELRTTIRSCIWRIMKTETPEQLSFFGGPTVPVSVELAMGREWVELLTQPQTAQYLPMGELLGSIPGNKPSGAWARVIGLALTSFWRRLPRESMEGSIKPTRRELLERYPPKTGAVSDLLSSRSNAGRALAYWCGALEALVEAGFIENVGEARISVEEMKASLPRTNWAAVWLNAAVDIRPASTLNESMKQRATAATKGAAVARKAKRKKLAVS